MLQVLGPGYSGYEDRFTNTAIFRTLGPIAAPSIVHEWGYYVFVDSLSAGQTVEVGAAVVQSGSEDAATWASGIPLTTRSEIIRDGQPVHRWRGDIQGLLWHMRLPAGVVLLTGANYVLFRLVTSDVLLTCSAAYWVSTKRIVRARRLNDLAAEGVP